MKRIRYISHKGVSILFADYSNGDPKEITAMIADLSEIVRQHAQNSVLLLEDVSNMHFDQDVISAKRLFWQQNKDRVKKIAMVGVEGLKTIIHNGMENATGMDLPTFKNLDSAKDWLTEDSTLQIKEDVKNH